jgi:prepilin-type N-terminal cleavage/methylation domain-containing protein
MDLKQRYGKAKRQRGFTITEIVVALFLISVGVLSLASVMSTMANRQNYSLALSTMTNLASTTLEQIKSMSYESVVSTTEEYGEIADHPTFKRQVIVTPSDDDLLKVIEVRMTNQNGQSMSVETVVAR